MALRGRRSFGVALLCAVSMGTGLGVGCGKSSSGATVASTCSLNSDCDSPLVCVFSKCHAQCATSVDCPSGERCVPNTAGGSPVCQLPAESTCAQGATCDGNQVCSSSDDQCRAPCQDTGDCPSGQFCVATAGASTCYQVDNVKDQPLLQQAGAIAVDGAVLIDASSDATLMVGAGGPPPGDGSAGSQDAAGGGGDGQSKGPDATTSSTCTTAQTQFPTIAQGDSNPHFFSGVGVQTGGKLLIFTGYIGPDPAGGEDASGDAGTTNYVYVQAFDPTTGASLGAAQPFFEAPAGPGFTVHAAAVAPTGEVALVLGFNSGGYGAYVYEGRLGTFGYDDRAVGLYATFLAPGTDGGAAGLQVTKTIQIETAQTEGQPHVVWSVAKSAFTFSWEYVNGPWILKVKNFLPNGNSTTGGTDVVPTDDPSGGVLNDSYTEEEGATAPQASTGLCGVAFMSDQSGEPNELTILDTNGNRVGTSLVISESAGYWVALGATKEGFVYVYDAGNAVTAAFVPSTADAGVPAGVDGGDAAALATFSFTGAVHAIEGRAVNDDTGGAGGVGLALLYLDGASFAYIDADGATHVGPTQIISHMYHDGDQLNVSNSQGSFAVSLFSEASNSAQLTTSVCGP